MCCERKVPQLRDTGERTIEPEDSSGGAIFLRHKAAYMFAEQFARDKLVLDDGCGSGYGSYYLATKGAKKVIGIDVAADAVEYAKNRYHRKNLLYEVMNSNKLSFCDEYFDLVTSFQVIEHIRETGKFLGEVSRVLKSSGVALISTPNKQTYSSDTDIFENPFHVKEYYLSEFYDLLSSYFKKIEILGVSRSARLEKLEKSASVSIIKVAEKIATKLHLSFVSRIIPKRVRAFLRGGVPDISDFVITEFSPEQSLDLIAVCKKI